MPACLGLLCAKRRTKAVDFPKGHGRRFVVKLAALRQVSRYAKIVGREQSRRTFADIGGQDGRVHEQEAIVVEIVTDALDDRGTYAHDRPLALRAEPQVTVAHQEVDAVLLGRYRVCLLYTSPSPRDRTRSRMP